MLSGKIALITGASRGIGYATARVFAQHGATVLLNGRSPETLTSRCHELKNTFGSDAAPFAYDVRDRTAISSAFSQIFKLYRRLDVLINNAGVLESALLGMITPQIIDSTINTNIVGPILHIQEAARLMSRNRSGSIINISSIMGTHGAEGQTAYAASKSAIVGMTLAAAKELAPKGIRVNAIAPGLIDTDMARQIAPERYQERLQSVKMGRIGAPEEVANAALFLASDLSSYITGQILGVDGGMVI